MLRRLVPVQDRGEAGIAAFQQLAPLGARTGEEQRGHAGLELGPVALVELLVEERIVQAAALAQQRVELRLDGAHRHVLAIGAGIGVVEMRRPIQQVVAALVGPAPGGLEAVHHGRQQSSAVSHGRVHHLPLARVARLVDRAHHAKRQQHAAAAKVADVVERHHGWLPRPANGVQRATDGDVVDVVAGSLSQRPVLAPAGHAAIYQRRVARQAYVRAQPQAFHHTGSKAFDQHVGLGDQVQHDLGRAGLAQVDGQGAPAARRHVAACLARAGGRRFAGLGQAGPVDADHLGTLVGQHHRAERRRADPNHFHHFQSRQRSRHVLSPVACSIRGVPEASRQTVCHARPGVESSIPTNPRPHCLTADRYQAGLLREPILRWRHCASGHPCYALRPSVFAASIAA